jgi:SAM-dependent methyltransferase
MQDRRLFGEVMATHQSLSGVSDEEFVHTIASGHRERYGAPFWTFFETHIAPMLPPKPVIIDLGCGPGLFLQDLSERYPQARLLGYDVTPAMIAYGQQLASRGNKPSLAVHDVARQPLPHDSGTVDLVTMTSVLHILDEPLPVLAEIRRVLTPQGCFLLHDWIRTSLQAYLAGRLERQDADPDVCRQRGFRLFPMHCKYAVEDWRWMLAEAGFTIHSQGEVRPTHRLFVTTQRPGPA